MMLVGMNLALISVESFEELNRYLERGIRAVEVSQSVEAPGTKRMYGRDTQPPDLRWLLSFQQPG